VVRQRVAGSEQENGVGENLRRETEGGTLGECTDQTY
jgi:hypothetical protein